MGLFNLFNRQRVHPTETALQNPVLGNQTNLPEINEDIFVEKGKPKTDFNQEISNNLQSEGGITLLFQFLGKNHESKGYDDALINPDTTHLTQNIEALKNDLERTIREIKTFYADFIREINFHIESRSRSGMIDTVEELMAKKQTAESHIEQIIEIENEAKENRGVGQGVIISYTRGFKNGLAAISHHSIMKRNF